MEFIDVDAELFESPVVLAIAKELRVDVDLVTGRLIRLWGWAARHVDEKGVAQGVTIEWIDEFLGCKGFGRLLANAGWVVRAEGGLTFPNELPE